MGTAALTAAWEVLWISNQTNMNMFLATLFFAASVSAEADPYLLGYHGLGYAGYPGYAGYGYALPYAAAGYASVSPSASLTTLGAAPAAIPAVEEPMLVRGVTSPTLLELSMSPRGKLRLIPTFWDMAATQATDMPASATPGTGTPAMVATALTHPLLV